MSGDLRRRVEKLRDDLRLEGHERCLRINCSTCASNHFATLLTAILDADPDTPAADAHVCSTPRPDSTQTWTCPECGRVYLWEPLDGIGPYRWVPARDQDD